MRRPFDLPESPSPQRLDDHLRQRFGFEQFRVGQREVIEAALAGRDALVVMPTGQGKSLCFQMPAALAPGLTVVVSPLIALMKDQVDALRAKGIAASAFHSGLSGQERDRILQDLKLARLRLLYLAPERVQHGWFVRMLRTAAVSRFVVDEAHCISRWGHDFRPDYLRLRDLRAELADPPCLALTATATVQVQQDICEKLSLRSPLRVVTGFHRPNLRFSVERCDSTEDKHRALERLLDEASAGSAIVYCATRRHVEEVAAKLQDSALQRSAAVGYYHAGLEDDMRASVHDRFLGGSIKTLVATNAFGMGIDKPDVGLVAHYDLPGSVEAYYQEAGRAGRDGNIARCTLLFHHRDVKTQEFFIRQSPDGHQDERRDLLRQMVAYASTSMCRQTAMLEYFGATGELACGPCRHCDWCLGMREGSQACGIGEKSEKSETGGKPEKSRKGTGIPGPQPVDQALFHRLRHLRAAIAAEEGVAAFLVFHDKTLRLIASQRPATKGALQEISGIGPLKMERYGRRVLAVVNECGGQ